MNTNIKITLTDEQRRDLQVQLTGKQRMISRAELCEFVDGVIEGALRCEALADGSTLPLRGRPNPDLTEIPVRYVDRFKDKPEHWRKGWLRGWNLVGRSIE